MKRVIVPLNAFNVYDVLEKGQDAFISPIYEAKAEGVEIRRELFSTKVLPLSSIREELNKYPLFIVYSAPVELWKSDYSFNQKELRQVFQEANEIGADWVKVSLGHFKKEKADFHFLKQFVENERHIQLLVENDQTKHGGNIRNFTNFFKTMKDQDIPIKMTFDIGNWHYSGENIQNAVTVLKEYVMYLHLKHVEKQNDQFVTLPLPNHNDAEWKLLLEQFDKDLKRALEFPIHPIEKLDSYIQLVELQQEKVGR